VSALNEKPEAEGVPRRSGHRSFSTVATCRRPKMATERFGFALVSSSMPILKSSIKCGVTSSLRRYGKSRSCPFPERLEVARLIGAVTVDFGEEDVSVLTALKELTAGTGPDACIDAVGLESHSREFQGLYDGVKTALMLETDRPSVLRQAIQAVRKGGTLSIPGVYGGLLDKVPFGAAFGKGITMKMGQTNMHNYMRPLLERIEKGQIDPSYLISHRITLDEAPRMYEVWRDKQEAVTKIVIDPWAEKAE
jgi:threonine dehydrogenase-like Zn-dependent dehydrogenase